MKLSRITVLGLAVSALAVSCVLGCGSTVVTGEPPQGQLWLVVHPTGVPTQSGILLYDVGRNKVYDRLPFPAGMTSPQALAWDGSSLWISGIGGHGRVCELDPRTGTTRSEFEMPERGASGLAAYGMLLWAVGEGTTRRLFKYDHDGDELDRHTVTPSVTDLVSDGTRLYWLADTGQGSNTIERVNPDTGEHRRVADMPYLDQGRYALGWDGHFLMTIESSWDPETGRRDRNALRWIDALTGETVDQQPIPVRGWITAMAWRSR